VWHFEGIRHLHELTFSCYQRRPLLTNDLWRGIFASNLSSACAAEDFRLIAFVLMPEHVHLLVLLGSANSKISRLLARMKQPTSRELRKLLEVHRSPLLEQLTVRERPGK
jgi:putative transposase